jgi:heat shock protein HslJ
LYLAMLLPLLVAACTASSPADSSQGPRAGTDALAQVDRWKLQDAVDAQGQPIAEVLPGGRAMHALVFADGRLGIQGGCNHMSGSYRVDGRGRLVVSDMQSTLMACEDQSLMTADSVVATLLEGSSEWSIESWPEQLNLRSADGRQSHWVADRRAR